MANADAPLPTQISWEHIKTEGWAIPLRTRKTNIKKGAEMRQLEKVRDAPSAHSRPLRSWSRP